MMVICFFTGESVAKFDDRPVFVVQIKEDIKNRRLRFPVQEIAIERGKFEKIHERRKEFYKIYSSLFNLKRKVLYLYEYVSLLKEKLTEECFLPTEFFIFFSLVFDEIRNILNSLNVIVKVLKFRRENAYQTYIPSTLLHRRYRLYHLHHFITSSFQKVVDRFLMQENSRQVFSIKDSHNPVLFLTSSDYDIGDLVTEKLPVVLIRGSFFWREQVSLLPLLFHEISHTLYQIVKEEKRGQLENEINDFVRRNSEPLKVFSFSADRVINLWQEIFADALSLLMIGDAYFFAVSFSGLWGLGYKKLSTVKDRDFYYGFQPVQQVTDELSEMEEGLLRIFCMKELVKGNPLDKHSKLKNYMISALNDLYPIINYEGIAFSHLTREKRALLAAKTHTIKFLAYRFLRIFKKLNLKPLLDPNPLEVFWEINPERLGIKLQLRDDVVRSEIIYKDRDDKVSFTLEEKEKNNKEVQGFSVGNIFEAMWDFNILLSNKLLNKMCDLKSKEKESLMTFWEGRIFRTFYLMKMPYFKQLLKKRKSVLLEMGELFLVKSRKAFSLVKEIDGTPCKEYGRGVIVKMLKDSLERLRKIGSPVFITTGPFDFVFFRLDGYKSAKESEDEIYKHLGNFPVFVDRHSIFLLNERKRKINSKRIAFIFIKMNNGTPDPFRKVSGEEEETVKSSLKEFVDKTQDYFFAFSSGWEHIILMIDEEASKRKGKNFFTFLFEDVISSLVDSSLLNRTETIICFSDLDIESTKVDRREKPICMMVSVRLDLSGMKKVANYKNLILQFYQQLSNKLEKKDAKVFLCTGRDDVVILKYIGNFDELGASFIDILSAIEFEGVSYKDIRLNVFYRPLSDCTSFSFLL